MRPRYFRVPAAIRLPVTRLPPAAESQCGTFWGLGDSSFDVLSAWYFLLFRHFSLAALRQLRADMSEHMPYRRTSAYLLGT